MPETSSDRSIIRVAVHGVSMLVMSGLLACGIGSVHGDGSPVARHVAIDVASSSVAESARVSIKLALASRDVRQLCKLVMAEQGVKLTWAEGDSESRAQHGLTALRHCAAMILQDEPFTSPARSPETC
jgi:hypothetical protein